MQGRSGTLLMLAGVVLAVLAAALVLGTTNRGTVVVPSGQTTTGVPAGTLVPVVVTTRDIAEASVVVPDNLTVKQLPAELVPPGALAAPEQAVGKYTVNRLVAGQIVLNANVSPTRTAGSISASVPKGKVGVTINVEDTLTASGILRPGDRVDLLLTLQVPPPNIAPQESGQAQLASLVTQFTIQNAEILAIGGSMSAVNLPPNATPEQRNQANAAAGRTAPPTVLTLLVDPQDAVALKYIKDAKGSIDLVLRSREDDARWTTDAVTLDRLFQLYGFRLGQPVSR